ncbi:hypothetical protein PC123_g24624 [Phytophthora cactorum]|nr:hypothetical protein PC123_g24624 [Phytophthora cactorum]
MTKIARAFAWDEIGETLLNVLRNRTGKFNYYEKRGDSDMELLLLVAGGVDDGIAKQALITAAMTKEAYDLSSLDAVEILWDVCRSGDKQTFDMVTSKIEKT